MIVVTLGTQRFQMDRLIKAVDELAPTMSEEIFIQTGHSDYVPQHCQYKDFVDAQEFQKMIVQRAGNALRSRHHYERYQRPKADCCSSETCKIS